VPPDHISIVPHRAGRVKPFVELDQEQCARRTLREREAFRVADDEPEFLDGILIGLAGDVAIAAPVLDGIAPETIRAAELAGLVAGDPFVARSFERLFGLKGADDELVAEVARVLLPIDHCCSPSLV